GPVPRVPGAVHGAHDDAARERRGRGGGPAVAGAADAVSAPGYAEVTGTSPGSADGRGGGPAAGVAGPARVRVPAGAGDGAAPGRAVRGAGCGRRARVPARAITRSLGMCGGR